MLKSSLELAQITTYCYKCSLEVAELPKVLTTTLFNSDAFCDKGISDHYSVNISDCFAEM